MEPEAPDRQALLSALTTEHVTLQSARTGTITESVGRSVIYMGSLSAALIALAFIGQSESTVDDFRVLALVILPVLVVLGTVTFVRIIETGIEDAICAVAINRIRRYYIELAGEDARYFLLGGHDDPAGGLANRGLVDSPWRPFFSVATVVALINSMVIGAFAGAAVDAFVPRAVAVAAALAGLAIAVAVHYRLGFRRVLHAMERFTPIFPSEPVPRP